MEKLNGKRLRNVAGSFATGITVVTVETAEGSVHGMTASSFVSMSLDPPLVGFFVKVDASIMQHLAIAKPIAISILSSEQKQISQQFAGQIDNLEISFNTQGSYHKIKEAAAWYETVIDGIIPAGDHYLISCLVQDLDRDLSKAPILYYSGYKGIGNAI